jgi:HSP20 family protein
MTLLKRNGSLFPSITSDLMNVDRFFGSSFPDFDTRWNDFEIAASIPPVNVTESEKEFKLELAAPGLTKKDFKVEMEDGLLTISSEKEEEKKDNGKNYKRREYSYSSFSRTFNLPENVKNDKIDAKYEDGILRLHIPKKEVTLSKPKKEIAVA